MLIDLSEILSIEGKTQVVEAPVSMDFFQSKLGSFPVIEKKPICVTLVNTGKKVVKIEAKGSIVLAIPCDKCLKDVPTEFEVDISEEIDMKASREDRIKDLDEN